MSKLLEIEFKTMLDENEFNLLYRHFQIGKQNPVLQYNYYYDTSTQSLKKLRTGFRLRTTQIAHLNKSKWESQWTLKQMIDDYQSYEYHQKLDKAILKAPASFSMSLIEETSLLNFFAARYIDPNQLMLFTHYKTNRWIRANEMGEFALDFTVYPNGERDFELELETEDLEKAHHYFYKFLANFHITFQQADKKISRALKNY